MYLENLLFFLSIGGRKKLENNTSTWENTNRSISRRFAFVRLLNERLELLTALVLRRFIRPGTRFQISIKYPIYMFYFISRVTHQVKFGLAVWKSIMNCAEKRYVMRRYSNRISELSMYKVLVVVLFLTVDWFLKVAIHVSMIFLKWIIWGQVCGSNSPEERHVKVSFFSRNFQNIWNQDIVFIILLLLFFSNYACWFIFIFFKFLYNWKYFFFKYRKFRSKHRFHWNPLQVEILKWTIFIFFSRINLSLSKFIQRGEIMSGVY